jgi:hypothetical protein
VTTNGIFMSCSPGSLCFEMMKGVPAAFVTLIIGGIVAGITWRQYKVAQAKLKLDLFERRYAIFEKVWMITSNTFRHGCRATEKMMNMATPFNNFRPEAAFLFGREMEAYIDELARLWGALWAHEGLKEEESVKNVDNAVKIQEWFGEQASHGVKDRFSRYLDFANWK